MQDDNRDSVSPELIERLAWERQLWACRTRSPGTRAAPSTLELTLGLHKRWFTRMKGGETTLSLSRLGDYLGEMDIPPGRFFRSAFPGEAERLVVEALGRHESPVPLPLVDAKALNRLVPGKDAHPEAEERIAWINAQRHERPQHRRRRG